ncbi:Conserved hypothetical protein [Prochlorococcus marinus str. MIT 9303]|uniref:Uncharacterized protein n=1 Tax=Prochlorococcus marinus (strain MIT 9303) TaxID=59922 RepID=A2C7P1_PROM3|nr:Conserved hypothetical protein [Prochlorococcus marinus str. MIT 9303]
MMLPGEQTPYRLWDGPAAARQTTQPCYEFDD